MAHHRGFPLEVWTELGLDERDWRSYLSTARYYAMQPLNGRFTAWVDDKLLMKYLCAGTELDRYMPAYYYLIDEDGRVCALPDAKGNGYADAGEIIALLREKGRLALKKITGACGEGFYKAEYSGSAYLLNGQRMGEEDFARVLSGLRSYIVTEYIRPHPELAELYSDAPNTIRYLVGRVGEEWMLLQAFIRFGTAASGCVEGYRLGGVRCYIDADGRYSGGNVIDPATGRNRVIDVHPDNGRPLRGRIPQWEEIVQAAELYCKRFPQMKYLGFDFVVAEDGRVKILETNSLSALDAIQQDSPVCDTDAWAFFGQFC